MWRRRQRRDGGGHHPRDGRLEPPEAGRGGKDPPLEPLQGAQPRDTRTSDAGPREETGCLRVISSALLRPEGSEVGAPGVAIQQGQDSQRQQRARDHSFCSRARSGGRLGVGEAVP